MLFNFSLIDEGAILFSLIGKGTILFFIDRGGHYFIFH